MESLIEFNEELLLDLRAEAAETDFPIGDLAFGRLCSTLEGEIETSDRTEYRGSSSEKTLRIDGHGGDPRETDGVLSVIACEIFEDDTPASLNAAGTSVTNDI